MKQFLYAMTLANEGSFSRAAERLSISQPSLSQYIKKIEQDLGAVLFDRNGAEVRLTDAGKVYIDAGRRILDMERQMQSRLDDLRTYQTGTVTIGISPHRAVCLMPNVVAEFRKLYPGIQVILDERVNAQLIDGALHGDFDLCITTLPVDEHLFVHAKMMREEVILAVPRESALNERLRRDARALPDRLYPAVDATLLDGADFAMLGDGQLMQKTLTQLCREHGLTLTKVVECVNIEALHAMVVAGLGCALVPSGLIKYGDFVNPPCYYSLRQETRLRDIVVMYRKEQYLSRPVRDMISLLTSL